MGPNDFGIASGDAYRGKITISKSSARAIGSLVGIVWLVACLIFMIWLLDFVLRHSIMAYGLVYPLILAACVILGFVGSSVLAKLLSSFIAVSETSRTFFENSPYVLVARQTVVVATVPLVLSATIAVNCVVRGSTSPLRVQIVMNGGEALSGNRGETSSSTGMTTIPIRPLTA